MTIGGKASLNREYKYDQDDKDDARLCILVPFRYGEFCLDLSENHCRGKLILRKKGEAGRRRSMNKSGERGREKLHTEQRLVILHCSRIVS